MAERLSLAETIAANLRHRDSVAMEGFTYLIPFAAGHDYPAEAAPAFPDPDDSGPDLRPSDRNGMRKEADPFLGRESRGGSLHQFRDAVENDWPRALEIEERSHSDMANAYVAGAANLPFAVLHG